MLLREQSLLRQWGNIEKVPAGVKKTAGGGIPMVAWGCWEGERERAVVGGGRERGGGGGGG